MSEGIRYNINRSARSYFSQNLNNYRRPTQPETLLIALYSHFKGGLTPRLIGGYIGIKDPYKLIKSLEESQHLTKIGRRYHLTEEGREHARKLVKYWRDYFNSIVI